MHTTSKNILKQNPRIAERVDECTRKIKKVLKPEKIILFGSYARGEDDDHGTMDFLIIAKTKLKFFERIKKVLEACSGGFPSVEPLVYTPQEFDRLLKQGEGFLEDAVEEGIIIYEHK